MGAVEQGGWGMGCCRGGVGPLDGWLVRTWWYRARGGCARTGGAQCRSCGRVWLAAALADQPRPPLLPHAGCCSCRGTPGRVIAPLAGCTLLPMPWSRVV